jgi:hypothetical protein
MLATTSYVKKSGWFLSNASFSNPTQSRFRRKSTVAGFVCAFDIEVLIKGFFLWRLNHDPEEAKMNDLCTRI